MQNNILIYLSSNCENTAPEKKKKVSVKKCSKKKPKTKTKSPSKLIQKEKKTKIESEYEEQRKSESKITIDLFSSDPTPREMLSKLKVILSLTETTVHFTPP